MFIFENIYDIVKIRNPTVKLFHFGRMHHEFYDTFIGVAEVRVNFEEDKDLVLRYSAFRLLPQMPNM